MSLWETIYCRAEEQSVAPDPTRITRATLQEKSLQMETEGQRLWREGTLEAAQTFFRSALAFQKELNHQGTSSDGFDLNRSIRLE